MGHRATADDKRTAIALSTNLSGQLVQSAVAMLTVEGAYIAYALVSRDTIAYWFETTALVSAAAFTSSVYFSGKGITEARNSGFTGKWILSAGRDHFNYQAISLIWGLISFALMLWLSGSPKETDLQKKVDELAAKTSELQAKIDTNNRLHEDLLVVINSEKKSIPRCTTLASTHDRPTLNRGSNSNPTQP